MLNICFKQGFSHIVLAGYEFYESNLVTASGLTVDVSWNT